MNCSVGYLHRNFRVLEWDYTEDLGISFRAGYKTAFILFNMEAKI